MLRSSASSLWIRRVIRRRSISSWVSPGPRTGADTARLLGQRATLAPQPRQPVAEQGQLDLRLALLAVGVLGEDVEDHRGPVDRGAPEQLLQVELLGRASARRRTRRCRSRWHRPARGSPRPCPTRRRSPGRGRPPLHHPTDHVGAGGVDQQLQLVERRVHRLVVVGREADPDQDDALPEGALDEGRGLAAELTEAAAVALGRSGWSPLRRGRSPPVGAAVVCSGRLTGPHLGHEHGRPVSTSS